MDKKELAQTINKLAEESGLHVVAVVLDPKEHGGAKDAEIAYRGTEVSFADSIIALLTDDMIDDNKLLMLGAVCISISLGGLGSDNLTGFAKYLMDAALKFGQAPTEKGS